MKHNSWGIWNSKIYIFCCHSILKMNILNICIPLNCYRSRLPTPHFYRKSRLKSLDYSISIVINSNFICIVPLNVSTNTPSTSATKLEMGAPLKYTLEFIKKHVVFILLRPKSSHQDHPQNWVQQGRKHQNRPKLDPMPPQTQRNPPFTTNTPFFTNQE